MSGDGSQSLAAGMDTARVTYAASAEEARLRAERDAVALAHLAARDAMDIAEILGLVAPVSARRRVPKPLSNKSRLPDRECEGCGNTFAPPHAFARACGKSCSAVLAGRTRKANQAAASAGGAS